MKYFFIATIFIFFSILLTAQEERYNFPDQIKCRFMPKSPEDKGDYYTNKGIWHGYSIPKNYDYVNYGRFGGPYCLVKEKWMSPSLLKLNMSVAGKGEVDLTKAKKTEIAQFPGLLMQRFDFEDIRLELNLETVTVRSSLYQALAINTSDKEQNISMALSGSMFEGLGEGEKFPDGWMFKVDGKDDVFWVVRFRLDAAMELSYTTLDYEFKFKQMQTVKPGDTLKITAVISQYFKGDSQQDVLISNDVLNLPDGYKLNNVNLWNFLFRAMTVQDTASREISIRSLQTMYHDLRSALPGRAHFAFFPYLNQEKPVTNTEDTWFTASAMLRFDARLSFNQLVMTMLSLNVDGSLNKYLSLNPAKSAGVELNEKPMAAWTAWNIYLVSPDAEFLKKIFPLLEKYHSYWVEYRDADKNGWIENNYGVESVALNAMIFTEMHCMTKMAEMLSDTPRMEYYKTRLDTMYYNFNPKFFDEQFNRYCDYDLKTNETKIAHNSIGYCFWAGLANKAIADIYANEISMQINTGVFDKMLIERSEDPGYLYILSMGLKSYKLMELSEAIKKIYIFYYSDPASTEIYPIIDGEKNDVHEYSSLHAAVMLLMTNY
ncbi:MAG: trehalase family glycosidase [Bacteroidales bacterium]|nr:trehalase family glycosidase [Bacteroidales bacterium]